jgi:hypothetical protein
LDEQVAAFRNRPLDVGPYAFVWVDALTHRVREGGRIINVHALIAVGAAAGRRGVPELEAGAGPLVGGRVQAPGGGRKLLVGSRNGTGNRRACPGGGGEQ